MPTFNQSDLIARALDNVAAQSLAPGEVIVVDDASIESIDTASGDVSSTSIRVMRHETHCGVAATRNTGGAVADGSILAFLDTGASMETAAGIFARYINRLLASESIRRRDRL